MKFTDGQWVYKEGVHPISPVEIMDYQIEETQVTIYAAVRPVKGREDTLDQGMLTMNFSFSGEDILKIRFFHHLGKGRKEPEFELNEKKLTLETTLGNNQLIVRRNLFQIKISLGNNFLITYWYKNRKLTSMDSKGAAYMTVRDQGVYVKQQLSLGVGECVYGLGERFTAFVKNGQSVDIWNEDGGTASEIAYKNIPFYLTSNEYGVFVNHPGKVSFEVASEQAERVQFSVKGEEVEYFLMAGGSMKQVISGYTELTGRPALPPAWSFGLWLSTSFTTDYDEKTINEFVDKMRFYEIPMSVFHFDCFWMKEFQWCDFTWDPAVFPDPEGMLTRLKEKNTKICVWINPYISQKSKLFLEGMGKKYFIQNKDGSVWQWDRWQAGMAIVDFTNPQALEWYQQQLRMLIRMGVDCFKTDFGERIPEEVMYYDHSDPEKMHNYYTYLYNKAVYEVMQEERTEGVLFARSATAGCQKFPVHWGGDCWGSYESMAECLRGGLSLCLSGFGYWSHDIGGFETSASSDLYKRWVAFGLLSTHSRLHGSHSYRVPWNYDEEACHVLRYFTQLKCSLMPYLYDMSKQNQNSGIPVMRPMILEFVRDKLCKYLDLQYMLGENLLVAPIFREDGIGEFYLPEGTWTDFITGQEYKGYGYYTQKCSYMEIPLLVKENCVIATGRKDKPDYQYTKDITFRIYALGYGKMASADLYDLQGNLETKFIVIKTEQGYEIEIKGYVENAEILFVNKNLEVYNDEYGKILHDKEGTRVGIGTRRDEKIYLMASEQSD